MKLQTDSGVGGRAVDGRPCFTFTQVPCQSLPPSRRAREAGQRRAPLLPCTNTVRNPVHGTARVP
ncbi:hypothetical protein ERD78_13250 [Allopusillimonas soli]|uniref:Uncharacterized protein n=1 Tax=Allopusillimonas soli TaxID=659016 RepID=A0A853FDW1_9BURK|nr:hypothetical protein [Allopusillimonas soli]NYT37842.1 hypothetical protein [Allopusillimonas soli]TEA73747.1 hypothetical protein ERD78_13250 [Allopusillimonas soli]